MVLYRVRKLDERFSLLKLAEEGQRPTKGTVITKILRGGGQVRQASDNLEASDSRWQRVSDNGDRAAGFKRRYDPEGLEEYTVNWGSLGKLPLHDSGHLLGQLSKRPPK